MKAFIKKNKYPECKDCGFNTHHDTKICKDCNRIQKDSKKPVCWVKK